MNVPKKKKGAFTLIEVLVTMSIFILLSASIFGIIMAVLQSTSALQDNQNHRDQLVALRDYLKGQFGTLSAKGSLVSYRREDGEGLPVSGISWGEEHTAAALDAKIQPNGFYTLRLAHYEAKPLVTETIDSAVPTVLAFTAAIQREDVSLTWMPLVRDVKWVDWKFQDNTTTDWLPQWVNSGQCPTLIQLSVQLSSDLQPTVMDFWLPNLSPAMLAVPSSASTNN